MAAPEGAEVGIGALTVATVGLVGFAILVSQGAALFHAVAAGGAPQALDHHAVDSLLPAMEAVQVVGRIQGPGHAIDTLEVTVRVDGAASQVDLGATTSSVSSPQGAGQVPFQIRAVRDADGSLRGADPVMTKDDLAVLVLDLTAAGIALPPGTAFRLGIQPPDSRALTLDLHTPASYGANRVFQLS